MKYYIVDAFTDQPFGGNPAGVVILDGTIYVGGTAAVVAEGNLVV